MITLEKTTVDNVTHGASKRKTIVEGRGQNSRDN